MVSTIVTIESGGLKCLQNMCRLCMREEYLEDVFKENSLHQWISDYLSIMISSDDRKGHTICTVCRLRLFDFHQFWTRCQEVQKILQSMVRDEDEMPARLCESNGFREVKAESLQQVSEQEEVEPRASTNIPSKANVNQADPGMQLQSVSLELQNNASNHDEANLSGIYHEDEGSQQTLGLNDDIEIQEIKIETPWDDGESLDQGNQKARKVPPYQCSMCDKMCRTESQLRVHKRRIHGPRNHHCSVCDLRFPFRQELKKHELSKLHLRRIKAKRECSVQVDELKIQTDNDQKTGEYSCSKCSRTFSRQCKLKKHMKHHDAKSNEEQTFNLDDDELRSGSEEDDYKFSTNVSEKRIAKPRGNNCVDEKRKCNQCDKSFRNKERLRCHMKSHKAKNYFCPICGKPFLFPFAVQRHIPRHDPNYVRVKTYDGSNYAGGPFRCDLCHKEYALRSTLRSHVAQVHGPKRFQCHLCDTKFPTRHALGRHIRCHYRDGKD